MRRNATAPGVEGMVNVKRSLKSIALVLVVCGAVTGCQSSSLEDLSTFGDPAKTVADDASVAFYRDDELLPKGKLEFETRHYGKAYAIYKKAVTVFPKDPAAWLGFAASADMISRFDTSDHAYARLHQIIGNSPIYYNNIGYSYLLRGKLETARRYFLKAYELDPSNAVTADNLQLMKNSVKYAQR